MKFEKIRLNTKRVLTTTDAKNQSSLLKNKNLKK